MWVYRSITALINVFDFTVSRHWEGPEIFLEGFADRADQAPTAFIRSADPMAVVCAHPHDAVPRAQRSDRPEVFKWRKSMDDFVHGQLDLAFLKAR